MLHDIRFTRQASDRAEARFFFLTACAMATSIVAGFTFNAAMGRSSFAMPWLVHVHALVFMGFVGLYVMQTALVFVGKLEFHRRLGWLAAVLIPAMVVTGAVVTRWSLQDHGGPPFFDKNQFLVSNQLQLWAFAALAAWAIALRRNTGWHRRLMYCTFALLTGPGISRLLPAPLFVPYAWYIAVMLPALVFVLVGILWDKLRYGRVHPAWLWGICAIGAAQIIADLIAYSSIGYRFTDWFLAGTPGAERPMEAFISE